MIERKGIAGKAKKIAELLKILANENRLLILCVLMENPRTVSELMKRIPGITQSAVSQHLSLLKTHGFLDSVKSGLRITYSIADSRVKDVICVLKKHYCK